MHLMVDYLLYINNLKQPIMKRITTLQTPSHQVRSNDSLSPSLYKNVKKSNKKACKWRKNKNAKWNYGISCSCPGKGPKKCAKKSTILASSTQLRRFQSESEGM